MMDEYESAQAVDRWFAVRGRSIMVGVGAMSGAAVLTASIIEILKAFGA